MSVKPAGVRTGAPKNPSERSGPTLEAPAGVERPYLTVDVVTFALRDDALSVLTIERGVPPFEGRDALPGGFVLAGETVEHAAARELVEETGVDGLYLEQLYTFSNPARDPRGRVVSVAHLALMPADRAHDAVKGGSDARSARWMPVASLLDLSRDPDAPRAHARARLAFDHDAIVAMALLRLRGKLEYTTLAFRLLASQFTLSEAQRAYEIVLGRPLDKVTFRRRIEALGVLRETPHLRTGAHRPARLFTAVW